MKNLIKVSKYSSISLFVGFTTTLLLMLSTQNVLSETYKDEFKPRINQSWWPNQIDLSALKTGDKRLNPYGSDFNYAKEFSKLNLVAVKQDINKLLTTSQPWWPADYGNYGPFFIRMAWHSAGTYRTIDGRGGADGGQQRLDPLASWPDNGNLDKARRLLLPIKLKYGRSLSWGDLMVLAGNVALENMGFQTAGFAGGRTDDWEPELVFWGPEAKWMGSDRRDKKTGELMKPLGAAHMGLIYINPEGPQGKPDPVGSAKDIRETFARMSMNDEETVALIAGGHAFGKMHGAVKGNCNSVEPGAAPIEQQGLGWKNSCGKGNAEDTLTSGLEGAWTQTPVRFSTLYLANLLNNDWEISKSPAGAIIWTSKKLLNAAPDAHVPGKTAPVVMNTGDMALKADPAYNKIATRFLNNPEEFKKVFANAWFKLVHRDMGPRDRYLGNDAPKQIYIWQDPISKPNYKTLSDTEIETLKASIANSGLTVSQMVKTAWAAASSFRASDMRGGVSGARINLLPQKNWEVNEPQELNKNLAVLKAVQDKFNEASLGIKVSLADIIVLAGVVGIEKASLNAGVKVRVPFTSGRGDATQAQTDANSFMYLEPTADAFRNYYSKKSLRPELDMMVDKASQLNLTIPEMTALIGGLRVIGATYANTNLGVLTNKPGALSNDFFVNLLDTAHVWEKSASDNTYVIKDRKTGAIKYTATSVDLIFGSSADLRTISEVYASSDGKLEFIKNFVLAWSKVMDLDRFDLRHDLP